MAKISQVCRPESQAYALTPMLDPRLRCTWMCECRGRIDALERPALDPTYEIALV